MKNKLSQIVLFASKINSQHIQLAFVLLTLVALVIGVGAPDDGSSVGR